MNKRLCVNCLWENHFARTCRSFSACIFSGCGTRHHSLLHPPREQKAREVVPAVGTVETNSLVNAIENSPEGQCAVIGSGKGGSEMDAV